jgi:cytochrome c-type biogenesis protein CcmE
MKPKQLKFLIVSVVIVLVLGYLGYSGFNQFMSYSQTVSELYNSKDKAYERRLTVMGDVAPDSIVREGQMVKFVIMDAKTKETLPVHYVGNDPLPDTFHDYATANVTGRYGKDGVFTGDQVLAKCASKYEKESAAGVKGKAGGD